MDSAALRSLTPIFDGIDRWVELAPLLPVIISLELILSADNAIALASITRKLRSLSSQRMALNFGITLSLVFRIIVILMAQFVLKFWPIKLIAGLYLLALFLNKLREINQDKSIEYDQASNDNIDASLIRTVIVIALTDLAFSIDSVAAAVAISDQFLLVITGAIIGVIALRFTSGLFIKWLEEYINLEIAGYVAVGLVGLKLLVVLAFPLLIIPEWLVYSLMIVLFLWGFSRKTEYS